MFSNFLACFLPGSQEHNHYIWTRNLLHWCLHFSPQVHKFSLILLNYLQMWDTQAYIPMKGSCTYWLQLACFGNIILSIFCQFCLISWLAYLPSLILKSQGEKTYIKKFVRWQMWKWSLLLVLPVAIPLLHLFCCLFHSCHPLRTSAIPSKFSGDRGGKNSYFSSVLP